MLALGGAAHIRQAVCLELEDTPAVGEEEQRVVRLGAEQVPHGVVFVRRHAARAAPAAPLRAVRVALPCA